MLKWQTENIQKGFLKKKKKIQQKRVDCTKTKPTLPQLPQAI